jgi:predicted transcriptional regulator
MAGGRGVVPTVKELVLRVVAELPDDVSMDEVVDRLLFIHKIERGIEQLGTGRHVTQDEVRERIARWLE